MVGTISTVPCPVANDLCKITFLFFSEYLGQDVRCVSSLRFVPAGEITKGAFYRLQGNWEKDASGMLDVFIFDSATPLQE